MKTQLLLHLSLFLLLSACNKKEENIVNVGLLNGPSSIAMSRSISQQTYQDGLKINYLIKDNPQHLRALLQSKHLDMAILPMTMAYSMIENNIDIKIFAITGWGNLFVLSRDSLDLTSEKKIIISVPGEGQTPDLATQFLIDYLSLKNKVSLNYTYTSPLLLTGALSAGKVQYAVLPEPLSSLAQNKDAGLIRSLDIGQWWQETLPDIPLIQSVFVVKGDFYKNNKAWFSQYADSLENKILYAINHPELTLKLSAEKKLIPPELKDVNILINSRLDFVKTTQAAEDMTRYLKTFYTLDENFDIKKYLIDF